MARIECDVAPALVLVIPEPVTKLQAQAFMALLASQQMPLTRSALVIEAGKSFIKFAKEIMKEQSHGSY